MLYHKEIYSLLKPRLFSTISRGEPVSSTVCANGNQKTLWGIEFRPDWPFTKLNNSQFTESRGGSRFSHE